MRNELKLFEIGLMTSQSQPGGARHRGAEHITHDSLILGTIHFHVEAHENLTVLTTAPHHETPSFRRVSH